MKPSKTSVLLLLLFVSTAIYATGPSYVRSWIRPVSVNKKGDILCRTRYEENTMGGHWYMSSEYGLCVITKGRIIEYRTKYLDNSIIGESDNATDKKISEEEYIKLQNHWDWVYKIDLDFDNLSKQQQQICEKYGFKENNAKNYKVDKRMTLSEFNKEFGVDLSSKKQHALKGATSLGINNPEIHLLYRFEKVFIFNNYYADYPEKDTGDTFNYVNPSEGIFENFDITSILFLK